MKPHEKKPETVFRIIDRETGGVQSSYSRAYCDEYDFASPESARNANCHGMFRDKAKYAIAKYKVTYELIEEDVDPPTEADLERERVAAANRAEDEAEMVAQGITEPFAQMKYIMMKDGIRKYREAYLKLAKQKES